MNDSATPSGVPDSQPELARRLDLVANTTTMDIDAAWDNIQARIATPDHGQTGQAGTRRRAMLAVAAALLILVGATTILNRHDNDDDKVRTEDRTTTSTTNRRSTSSTTAPDPSGTAPTSGGSATGTGSGSGSATGPGGSEQANPASDAPGGAGTPTGPNSPGSGTPAGSGASLPAAPTRASAVASTWSEQYCCGMTPPAGMYQVELVYAGGVLYFRRVDDVGSTPGPPDGYGSVDTWIPGGISGTWCLATAGGVYQFPNDEPKSFMWGLAGPDVASITITVPGQPNTYTGPALPLPDITGLSAWIISLPPGQVERIEGSDANANVVATITNPPDGYTGSTGC
jgi:hypothetical protein